MNPPPPVSFRTTFERCLNLLTMGGGGCVHNIMSNSYSKFVTTLINNTLFIVFVRKGNFIAFPGL
jgi:hypothetical protein